MGIDIDRVIEAAAGLRRWLRRQPESVAAWAESGTKDRSNSGTVSNLIARSIPGADPVQLGINPGLGPSIGEDEPTEKSTEWSRILSPPIIVVSVAAIAQICWHCARWWNSRRRSGQLLPRNGPVIGLAWDGGGHGDRMILWGRAAMISRPLFRRSRAT
jgi:hypothetical protein